MIGLLNCLSFIDLLLAIRRFLYSDIELISYTVGEEDYNMFWDDVLVAVWLFVCCFIVDVLLVIDDYWVLVFDCLFYTDEDIFVVDDDVI